MKLVELADQILTSKVQIYKSYMFLIVRELTVRMIEKRIIRLASYGKDIVIIFYTFWQIIHLLLSLLSQNILFVSLPKLDK